MKIVGNRIVEKPISFEPRGDYLKEIAMWNDTIEEVRFFPKGIYRYKTHEEADEHYLNCLANKIAKNELKKYGQNNFASPKTKPFRFRTKVYALSAVGSYISLHNPYIVRHVIKAYHMTVICGKISVKIFLKNAIKEDNLR